jgi:hypothetical protein
MPRKETPNAKRSRRRKQEPVTIEVEIVRSNLPLSPHRRAAMDAYMAALAKSLLGPEQDDTSDEKENRHGDLSC